MKTNIYVFRHGETDYNVQGRMQGYLDIPLNNNGIAQARILADKLSDLHLEYIYSSPLSRALKTAQIVADKNNIKIISEQNLSEWNLGIFCGHIVRITDLPKNTPVDFNKDIIQVPRALLSDDDFVPEHGESYNMFKKRVRDAIMNIVKNTNAQNIGIASHGGVIKALIREFTDWKQAHGGMPNAGFFKMCWDGTKISVPEKPDWLIIPPTQGISY